MQKQKRSENPLVFLGFWFIVPLILVLAAVAMKLPARLDAWLEGIF